MNGRKERRLQERQAIKAKCALPERNLPSGTSWGSGSGGGGTTTTTTKKPNKTPHPTGTASAERAALRSAPAKGLTSRRRCPNGDELFSFAKSTTLSAVGENTACLVEPRQPDTFAQR